MSNPESQEVTDHINAIDAQFKPTVELLRQVFLSADVEIAERIKWNSPSFYYTGDMQSFDAKEYKRDLVIINVHRGKILLVFPTGNRIDSKIGLLGKDYPDGRRIVEIKDAEDAQSKIDVLKKAVKDWLGQIEK